jgi:hypothetical protein
VGVIDVHDDDQPSSNARWAHAASTAQSRVESLGTCPATNRKDVQHGWPASRREQTRAINGRLMIINVRNRKDSPTKHRTG